MLRFYVIMPAVGCIISEFHSRRSAGLTLSSVRIGSLISRMLDLCRIHGVSLEPAMANIILSVVVLEGVGRGLDGEVRITRILGECLWFFFSWVCPFLPCVICCKCHGGGGGDLLFFFCFFFGKTFF